VTCFINKGKSNAKQKPCSIQGCCPLSSSIIVITIVENLMIKEEWGNGLLGFQHYKAQCGKTRSFSVAKSLPMFFVCMCEFKKGVREGIITWKNKISQQNILMKINKIGFRCFNHIIPFGFLTFSNFASSTKNINYFTIKLSSCFSSLS